MSGVGIIAVTAQVSTGTSAKTILQLVAASNHAILITEWSISFEGTSNTAAPIQVILMRQTTAGTMSALTLVFNPDDLDETPEASAQHTSTSEPSSGNILDGHLVHPQTGYTWQAPFGGEFKIGGGDRVGIVVTAGSSIDCIATIKGHE